MIVKRNLSPTRIAVYVRGPMVWATAWAVAVPLAYAVTHSPLLVVPFAVVATVGAALAIFIAFRNNTAFGRWNEARAAIQAMLVASRSLTRLVVAATSNAVRSGTTDDAVARSYAREIASRLIEYVHSVAAHVRPGRVGPDVGRHGAPDDADAWTTDHPPNVLLTRLSIRLKDGIRDGVLGQFDPISMEPQMAALATAQGVVERIATTPTPRQYDYFTRRFVEVFAALIPFGLLSLPLGSIWWAVPLAVILSGIFIIMAVTGSANDEPFATRVTDVPMEAVFREVERDLMELTEQTDRPAPLQPVDGYLW